MVRSFTGQGCGISEAKEATAATSSGRQATLEALVEAFNTFAALAQAAQPVGAPAAILVLSRGNDVARRLLRALGCELRWGHATGSQSLAAP